VVDASFKALTGMATIAYRRGAAAFATFVLAQSTLTLDGVGASWRLEKVTVPARDSLGLGDVIKIYAVAQAPRCRGGATLSYGKPLRAGKEPAIRQHLSAVRGGWRYDVTAQQRSDDGQQFRREIHGQQTVRRLVAALCLLTLCGGAVAHEITFSHIDIRLAKLRPYSGATSR